MDRAEAEVEEEEDKKKKKKRQEIIVLSPSRARQIISLTRLCPNGAKKKLAFARTVHLP
jgi:hypothetical protein